jgi:AraC-type DNA-binding domain-containing proteins
MNLGSLFPIIPAADAPPFEIMRAEAKLRLLLSYYMEHYPKNAAIRPADYAELAKEYIANNYWQTTITVSDIASAVRIERSYLFRLFKDATGLSVSAYLASYRIRRACELLRTSGLTVKSVAYSVGYQDQLHFSRVFKKATSHTPTEYAMLHAARVERQ